VCTLIESVCEHGDYAHKISPQVFILRQIIIVLTTPPYYSKDPFKYRPSTYVWVFRAISLFPPFPPKLLSTSLLPYECCTPSPSQPLSLDYSNFIWRRVHVMKFLITQFYPSSYYFILLVLQYSPALRHPQSEFHLQSKSPFFTPIQN
jgi:hypothetical protein